MTDRDKDGNKIELKMNYK